MLKKLLKWEIKATARYLIPLYLSLLLFALINRIFNPFAIMSDSESMTIQSVLSFISIITYFSLLVGIMVATLLAILQRFYKNLLTDEGYLMFTLPTATWTHLVSKLLVALLWTLCSGAVAITSILITARVEGIFDGLYQAIRMAQEYLDITFFLILPLNFLLVLVTAILMVYTAITLGHLVFPKSKVLGSFGMYVGLYLLNQFTSVVGIWILSNLFSQNFATNWIPTSREATFLLTSLGLYQLLRSGAYFFVTHYMLKNKLNLA